MNYDQRKSFRIQIPEGREHATLFVGKQQVGVRILDESAGGFAVALLTDEDVQQNQVHTLKTATGLYETRVARIEHFEDGKLIGLMRLKDLSETDEKEPQPSWRDYVFPAQQATSSGGGMILGIGATAVVGVLVCVLAAYFIRYAPARRSATTSPLLKEYSESLTEGVEKAREAAKEAAARKAKEKEQISEKLRPSAEYLRQQARVSAEVLYRLQLDADQSRRIRDILTRTSGDTSAAEAEIRSVLTAEQARQWQSLAP